MIPNYKLKDLAKMLHMSPSTVSKALNDYPSISEITRQRVKELAKKLNFIPDQTAISFKSKKSFSIGVIIPNLLDQFYTLAVSGIEEYAMANSYKAIVSQHYEDLQREIEITEMMSKYRVDGLIVSITKNTTNIDHFKKLETMGIPVVYFVRRPVDEPCFNVTSNVYKGTFDAVNYLVKKGHKRIAHILGPQSLLTTKERYQGYLDGLKANNLPLDKSLLYSSDLSTGGTIRAVDKLLSLKDVPTAIIAFKDYIVMDAMQYIKSLTKRSYRKIEWVGFGNLPMLRYLDNPPLASLEEQCALIGSRSAELLMKRIRAEEQKLPPESIQFDCTLKELK
ncbi:MAG TPA: LacI family DNA-binding transcriptional regulator [Chitinophagaceae bacterium]|nr:LacI family DNA-binding transcriptional regulator [Chitinophagaceae bacterium]